MIIINLPTEWRWTKCPNNLRAKHSKGKGISHILFAIVALGGNLVSPMEEIAAKFTLVASMKEIKSKLIKMMNIKDEEKTDIHFDGFKNEIAFKDASFGYEDDNRIVIDGMNLRLEKGKK